ncbi:MAG: replicative DNA helicase [Bacteroidales bacterium]
MAKSAKSKIDRTSAPPVLPLDLGKMPPQNVELEEVVLGAIMLEKDAIISVIDILSPASFYVEAHQKIYKAIIDLFTTDRPIDILTVTEELRRQDILDEVGGAYYIAQLTSRVATSANIEFHARIIQQKYIQRELIRISSEIQTRAYDESIDVNDLLDFSEAQLFEVVQGNIKKETVPINLLISEAIKQIEEAGKRDDHLSGVPSGFTRLDNMTLGWQNSDLIIVAARPSMGKTAFVLSMARNMAVEYKKAVAIFSLEMSSMQLVNRLISIETEIPSTNIRKGKLRLEEWRQLNAKIKSLESAPIYIDDTPGISIFELRAKCRRLKKKFNIDVVIIDYLQLMTGPPDLKGNREQEVSVISRSLKGLAKELNIPIIALSQLNRAVENRTGNKRPQLSDLRESGAIEQDADVVCFIHRPEKYGMLVDDEGNSLVGIAEIIVAKHRNGAVGDVRLRFRDEIARFVELDEIAPIDENFDVRPIITKSSRMNEEVVPPLDDFKPNTSFDDETPF